MTLASLKDHTSFKFLMHIETFIITGPTLKGQCHEDFAVLGQFCAKIITLKLRRRYQMNSIREG